MKPNVARMKSNGHKLGEGLRATPPRESQDEAKGRNQQHTVRQMTSKSNLEISDFQTQADGINRALAAVGA